MCRSYVGSVFVGARWLIATKGLITWRKTCLLFCYTQNQSYNNISWINGTCTNYWQWWYLKFCIPSSQYISYRTCKHIYYLTLIFANKWADQWRTQEFCSGGGVSTNSVEDRGQRERGSGGSSPIVRGCGGSRNLVEEISFQIINSP